jgi:hypothetical protein
MEAVEAARVLKNLTKCTTHYREEMMTHNEDQLAPNGRGEAFLLMVRLMFHLGDTNLMLKYFLMMRISTSFSKL